MLAGYFDESGITDNDPTVIVGGVVADTVIWSRIEKRWTAKLRQYNLRKYHAVECEWGRGDFSPYSRPIRESLTNFFSQLAVELEGQAFVSAINRRAWKVFADEETKNASANDPFFMAFQLGLQQVSSWSRQFAGGHPVALVFAHQQQYLRGVSNIHEAYAAAAQRFPGIGSISYEEPNDTFQLQVADLICYESHRFAKDKTVADRQTWTNIANGPGRMAVSFMIYEDEHSFAKLSRQIPRALDRALD